MEVIFAMNKKQNIIVSYISIALIIILIVGFNANELGKLNHTAFFALLVTIAGLTAVIVTRGENGVSSHEFFRFIFPVILIPSYLIICGVFFVYSIKDLTFEDISSDSLVKLEPKVTITKKRLEMKIDGKFNLVVGRVAVVVVRGKSGTDFIDPIVIDLGCYRSDIFSTTCSGVADLRETYDSGDWSWSVESVKGRYIYPYVFAALFLFIYLPLGMSIVLLSSAREAIEDDRANKSDFIRRFAFYAIVYAGGIILWPIFLNSWFSNSKVIARKSVLDEFVDAIQSSSNGNSKADLDLAVDRAYTHLLCKVVGMDEVNAKAVELISSSVPYSTNDLALSVALHFFKRDDLKDLLSESQLFARLKLQDWIREKSVNLVIANSFEELLYTKYK